MPTPRYETMDPEKKGKLLDAATREFAAHGYELASINTILEEAGLSKSSFYYAFEDKADFAATVMLTLSEPAMRLGGYEPAHDADGWWAELRRVSFVQLRELESKRVVFEAITRLTNALAKDPDLASRVMPRLQPRARAVMGFMEQGVALGALRSDVPLPVLTSILQSVKQGAYAATFPHDEVPTDEALERFSDLILDLAQRICRPEKGVKP